MIDGCVRLCDGAWLCRYRITHREGTSNISEWYQCAVTVKGVYIPPGRKPNPGERKVYMLVEGPTEINVQKAVREIVRLLEETTMQVGFTEKERAAGGKYQVV